jgi:hypothetical protein
VCDQAFKNKLINAFKDQYLNALSDEIAGYENCTSLQLRTRLLTYYAMIAPTKLTQNYERLNTPYDPKQLIENLFPKNQDARAFLVAGGQPYGYKMIVNVAFTLGLTLDFFSGYLVPLPMMVFSSFLSALSHPIFFVGSLYLSNCMTFDFYGKYSARFSA